MGNNPHTLFFYTMPDGFFFCFIRLAKKLFLSNLSGIISCILSEFLFHRGMERTEVVLLLLLVELFCQSFKNV